MRYEARLTAYDLLDTVAVATLLRSTEPGEESEPSVVLHYLTQVRGTGETDPRVWLRDALLALLEDI